MKMADGGFRPAYNVEFATDTAAQVIVGVSAETTGSDMGCLQPMVEQVNGRYEMNPPEWLVDGGFPSHQQLEAVAPLTMVYAPVPASKQESVDPHQPKSGDSEVVAAWRVRMGTEEAKTIYKERASTAECVNAQARERGLTRLRVRGKKKVLCVAYWFALAHNAMRAITLGVLNPSNREGPPLAACVAP